MALLILLTATPAAADIYKCIDTDGNLVYTDEGCPEGTREVDRKPDAATPQTQELQPPREPLPDRLKRLWSRAGEWPPLSPYSVGGFYGIMSVICFLAYWRDKRRAQRRQWRTRESTLHLLELVGGWPGGLLAQITLRHKIRKPVYQAVFWGIVGLHALVWSDLMRDGALSGAVLQWVQALV